MVYLTASTRSTMCIDCIFYMGYCEIVQLNATLSSDNINHGIFHLSAVFLWDRHKSFGPNSSPN